MEPSSVAQASIAVIPARRGSKRIPLKNIRMMNGRPLIAWAIDVALASGEFSEVVVSTDDEEIAQIARTHGASVPFLRPAALADDFTPTLDVIAHALREMQRRGFSGDLLCCVYPAAILIDPGDLTESRSLLMESNRNYCAAVLRYAHPIQRAMIRGSRGDLTFADPDAAAKRTQDLPPRWHDAGQFYWGRVAAWGAELPILPNAVGYEIGAGRAVDIDTEGDWVRAKLLHAASRR